MSARAEAAPGWATAVERASAEATPVGSVGSGDLASRLPPAAQAKLRRLREQSDTVRAALASATERRNRAVGDRHRATARIRQLQAERVADDHPSMAQAQHDLEVAQAAITELDGRTARLRAQQPRILPAIERWLRAVARSAELEEHSPAPEPKLARGQAPLAAIEAVRATIAERRADLHAVWSAPVPSATVKARLVAELDELARRGAPDVLRSLEFGTPLAWPTQTTRADLYGFVMSGDAPKLSGFAQAAQPDTLAIMAWAHRDAFVARIEADVDALADDSGALDDGERAEREAALLAQLLELERQEEALSELAEQQGVNVERRHDLDPRAFLGLSDALPGLER